MHPKLRGLNTTVDSTSPFIIANLLGVCALLAGASRRPAAAFLVIAIDSAGRAVCAESGGNVGSVAGGAAVGAGTGSCCC
jgi:hypothetical protein